jgi:hypothetical protein
MFGALACGFKDLPIVYHFIISQLCSLDFAPSMKIMMFKILTVLYMHIIQPFLASRLGHWHDGGGNKMALEVADYRNRG